MLNSAISNLVAPFKCFNIMVLFLHKRAQVDLTKWQSCNFLINKMTLIIIYEWRGNQLIRANSYKDSSECSLWKPFLTSRIDILPGTQVRTSPYRSASVLGKHVPSMHCAQPPCLKKTYKKCNQQQKWTKYFRNIISIYHYQFNEFDDFLLHHRLRKSLWRWFTIVQSIGVLINVIQIDLIVRNFHIQTPHELFIQLFVMVININIMLLNLYMFRTGI